MNDSERQWTTVDDSERQWTTVDDIGRQWTVDGELKYILKDRCWLENTESCIQSCIQTKVVQ